MSVARWCAALICAVVSGFAAVICYYGGVLGGMGDNNEDVRAPWFALGALVLAVGVVAWAWLLPRARLWGVAAVLFSFGFQFVILGGLNTF